MLYHIILVTHEHAGKVPSCNADHKLYNATYFEPPQYYAVQILSSAYLLLSNVLVKNQRQLAREGTCRKKTYLPTPVGMDTKTSWPATKCLMPSHCSRDSRSYSKCSTAFAKVAPVSILAYRIIYD